MPEVINKHIAIVYWFQLSHACDICSNLLLPPAKQMINLEKVCVNSGGVHYGATLIIHSQITFSFIGLCQMMQYTLTVNRIHWYRNFWRWTLLYIDHCDPDNLCVPTPHDDEVLHWRTGSDKYDKYLKLICSEKFRFSKQENVVANTIRRLSQWKRAHNQISIPFSNHLWEEGNGQVY
jgi:hypothetical protein